jgi:hypothetical protein
MASLSPCVPNAGNSSALPDGSTTAASAGRSSAPLALSPWMPTPLVRGLCTRIHQALVPWLPNAIRQHMHMHPRMHPPLWCCSWPDAPAATGGCQASLGSGKRSGPAASDHAHRQRGAAHLPLLQPCAAEASAELRSSPRAWLALSSLFPTPLPTVRTDPQRSRRLSGPTRKSTLSQSCIKKPSA